jgi:hypothetical protein
MGLVELFEFLLRRLFVFGDIGMILSRERAEGLLDFFVGRLGRNTENPVIVFEFNGHGGFAWNASGH